MYRKLELKPLKQFETFSPLPFNFISFHVTKQLTFQNVSASLLIIFLSCKSPLKVSTSSTLPSTYFLSFIVTLMPFIMNLIFIFNQIWLYWNLTFPYYSHYNSSSPLPHNFLQFLLNWYLQPPQSCRNFLPKTMIASMQVYSSKQARYPHHTLVIIWMNACSLVLC